MMYIPLPILTLIKHCLTCVDGESYDIAKVCWVVGTFFFMGMTAVNIFVRQQPFDYVNWALGFSSIMAASSVAIKLKENSEPKA